jgi:hypothetical protein
MTILKKDIARIQKKYPKLTFGSHADARDFVNIHNILEHVFSEVDPFTLLEAYLKRDGLKLKTASDYYHLVTSTVIGQSEIKKTAYPLGDGGFYDMQINEVDLNKWVGLVHKIHKMVEAGDMSFSYALNYYSKMLDDKKEEPERFKKWVLYYKNGEHDKYAKENDMNIKKESDFQFGLNSSPYGAPAPSRDTSVTQKLESLEDGKRKEEEFNAWKTKVNGAIRRIDKLLRDDVQLSPEEQSDLADMLHAFDLQMRRVRMRSTATDISYQTATRFNKIGYSNISDALTSLAQDLEADPLAEPVSAPAASEAPPETLREAPEAQAPQAGGGASEAIGRALTTGEPKEAGHGDVFDELAQSGGQIDLRGAAIKLEEVAARLADRRTIRQLAEFDIMLDKLGIAALFPELAEAQSKLIDAYSYALVRVTKMLGMLSSGRSMSEITDAKKTDISNKAVKEVNKTFNQGDEPVAGGKGTESLNQEFGTGEEAPAPTPEAQPAPVE